MNVIKFGALGALYNITQIVICIQLLQKCTSMHVNLKWLTKLEGFIKRIEICTIFKSTYLAIKDNKHIYSNRNSLLRTLILTMKYNELFYSQHINYSILLILHNMSYWNRNLFLKHLHTIWIARKCIGICLHG